MVRTPTIWRQRSATIGLNSSTEAIIATGIAAGPSQGATANGPARRTKKDEAVTNKATFACPAMISNRSATA